MKALHSKQSEILKLLKKNSDNPLTIKDLSIAVNIDSPGVLYHHLRQLEKKGYLKKNPHNSKDYVVLDSPENSVVYIGKYGLAQCGPEGLILEETPEEYIPIASSLLRFPAEEAFIVEAEGDSMEPKIHQGDIVIAKRQNVAENGDIIVCSLNEQVKIKKIFRANGFTNLYSLNSQKHDPIPISEDDVFVIAGIVKNVLSYNFK
jgi:repressor LexA